MATKAELEAELAELRKQVSEGAAEAGEAVSHAPAALVEMLKGHGVDTDDIPALWENLSAELTKLPQNKPMMTAIAAFGLGFLLGRMSKS